MLGQVIQSHQMYCLIVNFKVKQKYNVLIVVFVKTIVDSDHWHTVIYDTILQLDSIYLHNVEYICI